MAAKIATMLVVVIAMMMTCQADRSSKGQSSKYLRRLAQDPSGAPAPAGTGASGAPAPNPPAGTQASGAPEPNPPAGTQASGAPASNPPAATQASGAPAPNPPAGTQASGAPAPGPSDGPVGTSAPVTVQSGGPVGTTAPGRKLRRRMAQEEELLLPDNTVEPMMPTGAPVGPSGPGGPDGPDGPDGPIATVGPNESEASFPSFELSGWAEAIESRLSVLENELLDVGVEIKTNAADLSEVKTTVADQETKLSKVETKVSGHATKLATAQSDIKTLEKGQLTCEAAEVTFYLVTEKKVTFTSGFTGTPALGYGMKVLVGRDGDVKYKSLSKSGVTFTINSANSGRIIIQYIACGHTH